jgi:16S rRNA (cytosine1402-N4)-methyltransferase
MTPQDDQNNAPPPHQRRKRYSGTHPRKFDQKYKEHDPNAYPELHEKLLSRGRTPAGTHVPVLINEVMNWLRPTPGEIVADCTVGYGGHALEFLRRISPGGRLIGFDVDGPQLERTRGRLTAAGFENFDLHRMNYAGIGNVLSDAAFGNRESAFGIREETAKPPVADSSPNPESRTPIPGYDVIFADLGISSMQVDDPKRGISYKNEGPLDMRMDDRIARTGADLLATLSERELSEALRDLADEPDHAKLAQWIVQQRQVQPIETTSQLVRLVLNAKGFSPRDRRKPPWEKPGGLHPAARTFQALRILVNDELGSLAALLRTAPYILRPGGRIGIISFHSGEDRLVKQSFRDLVRQEVYASISEDVIRPSSREINANPRCSSAKFRWARKKAD